MKDVIIIDGVRYIRDKETPAAKYQQGDWVKVVSNKSGRWPEHSYIGEVARIGHVYEFGKYKENGKPARAYGIDEVYVVFEDELEPAEEPKPDPFDVKQGDKYFYIDPRGCMCLNSFNSELDIERKEAGNACKYGAAATMRQQAFREILNRLLWQASEKSGEPDRPWDNNNYHYFIYREAKTGEFHINSSIYYSIQGVYYFPTYEAAKSAIKNVVEPFMAEHPDFEWCTNGR